MQALSEAFPEELWEIPCPVVVSSALHVSLRLLNSQERVCILHCEPSFPLQHPKTSRAPNLSKICPGDRFEGSSQGDGNL